MDPAEALQLARLAAPFFEKAGLPRMAPQVDSLSLSLSLSLVSRTHTHTHTHKCIQVDVTIPMGAGDTKGAVKGRLQSVGWHGCSG
jgi:hypothetical protein